MVAAMSDQETGGAFQQRSGSRIRLPLQAVPTIRERMAWANPGEGKEVLHVQFLFEKARVTGESRGRMYN